MGVRYEAFRDLVVRYKTIYSHVWANRREMDPLPRLPHEAHFLPAALALQESPVHPAPRITIWLLIGFFVLALLWAIFGRVDIVATATGKLIPNDRTKIIQPLEAAVIRAIHVADGQSVKPGDLLVELDPTNSQADTDRLSNETLTAVFEASRARAMLEMLDGRPHQLEMVSGSDEGRLASEQRLLNGQVAEYHAKMGALSAEISRQEAELRVTREFVKKLSQTAPIARQRAQDYMGLSEKQYVPRHSYLELEQAAIEQEQDLEAQKARLDEVAAALVYARRQQQALAAETRRVNLDMLHDAEQKLETASQELVKAEQRGRLTRLIAPVEGTIQQLVVHTVGGVVTPAQPLMVIVPKDYTLQVEAFVANRDIGFVYPGQDVRVKIDSFNFTKYGTIDGIVAQVSSDAIQDEKLGLVYAARIKLNQNTMRVEGKTVNLTPGMQVMAEIKTGKRRLIEYFLSPVLQYKDESLRER